MFRYRVWMRSKPGMWANYDGYVDVLAESQRQAEERARDQLKRTSFWDRPRSSWIVERVEPQ